MKNPATVTFSTVNFGERQSNGGWKVTATLTETATYPDGTSSTEFLEAMCFDDSFVIAQQTALSSVLIQYREEVLDLGFSSLIEAREGKNDSPKIDTDTPIQ